MQETLLLRSQIGIVHILTILIFFLFGSVMFFPLMRNHDNASRIFAVTIACLWLTYSINLILSLKVLCFYESYLTIKMVVSGKIITIPYHNLSSFHYKPKTYGSPLRVAGKNENDKVEITTSDGNKIILSEMRYDNFSSLRVMFQKIIRGEHLT